MAPGTSTAQVAARPHSAGAAAPNLSSPVTPVVEQAANQLFTYRATCKHLFELHASKTAAASVPTRLQCTLYLGKASSLVSIPCSEEVLGVPFFSHLTSCWHFDFREGQLAADVRWRVEQRLIPAFRRDKVLPERSSGT